jgi:hypothetical protein
MAQPNCLFWRWGLEAEFRHGFSLAGFVTFETEGEFSYPAMPTHCGWETRGEIRRECGLH